MSENEETLPSSSESDTEDSPTSVEPTKIDDSSPNPSSSSQPEAKSAPSPKPEKKPTLSKYDKMVQKLNGRDFRARNDAIRALGRLKDPRAREKLLEVVEGNHWNQRLRVAALDAVGRKGHNKDFQRLLQNIASDESQYRELRRSAITQLTRFRDPKLIPLFTKALEDEYRFIRFWAVRGLIKIGDLKATTALVQALGDDDEEIRKEAMAHLEAAGKEAAPALIKAFKNPNSKKFLRFGALGILGRMDHPERIATLIHAIQDDNDRVVTIALRGLGKAQDPQAIDPLINLYLIKENRRRLIVDALYRIGQIHQKEVVYRLTPFLVHENPDMIEFAKLMMSKFGNSYLYLGDIANDPSTSEDLKQVITTFMKEL